MFKTPFILATGEVGHFEPISAESKNDAGQPVRRFKKDLIRVGDFVKPSNDNQHIPITADRLAQWVNTFKAFTAAGNKVPVLAGHDFSGDPSKGRGWLTDMYVEGDKLVGQLELVGADAIEAAGRSDVSIFSPPDYTDSNGNRYEWPIRHVAMTTDPLITKLGPFIPIAASAGKTPEQVPLFIYRPETPNMDLKKIAAALGITEAITADNAEALICDAAAKLPKAADVEALKAENKTLKEKVEKAGDNQPLVLSANERYMGKRLVEQEADRLIAEGKMTPAQKDKLLPLITTDNAIACTAANTDPLAMQLLKTFAENDPVKLGEQTKRQAIVASRQTPGDGQVKAPTEDEIKARAAKAHGRPVKAA